MEIVLIICATLCLLIGLIGCILPIIPSVPISWIGLLLVYFVKDSQLSLAILLVCAIATIAVTILDNLAPIWLTHKTGGTKAGTRGSTVGLIIGFFLGPIGIILCPFLGAFIGELIHDKNNIHQALKSAWASFLGFILGTGIKIITCSIFIWIFIKSLI